MPVTKSRANYPLSNEGQPQEPQFVRIVNASGNDLPVGSTGSLNTTLMQPDSANTLATQFDNTDGQVPGSQANKLLVITRPTGFNGTGWDMSRGDTNGMVVQPALSATFWNYAAAAGGIVSSTADVALKAAGAAGVRNYLKSMTINHDTLSAVTECVVKDGATIIWRGKLQTAATDVANGAGTIHFDPPLRGTAATALNFALLTSVTGGVFVNAQGYTGS